MRPYRVRAADLLAQASCFVLLATSAVIFQSRADAQAAPTQPVDAPVRVIHLPDRERQQILEELKREALAAAKAEREAEGKAIPDWINRIHLGGDIRVRQEFDFLDAQNDPNQINFQAINSGSPININPAASPVVLPYLNSTENREQPRVRARFGLTADVADDLTAGFRFASGNTTNPVSTNQTLGNDFNKLTLVIDRVYLNYQPLPSLSFWAGRMPNPWQSTELVFDEDLNFDGFAGQFRFDGGALVPWATLGVFSVENAAFDFPSTNSDKIKSRDKWLFAGQLGADWKIAPQFVARGAVAYYDFKTLQGKSSVCANQTTIACAADESRPGFVQKGNTMFPLRISSGAAATDPEFQYFGLASPFRILDITLTLDWALSGGRHLMLTGDYARNLAYDWGSINALGPSNNFKPCDASAPSCEFGGGSQAYLAEIRFGHPKIRERWQWTVVGGYRRLGTDAVVDAFTDSDFHLGGTNAKGYYVGTGLGLTHNAWLNLAWFSASEARGSQYEIDVLHLDLNARF